MAAAALSPLPQESKLPQVETTIFTVMSAMAAEYGALNLAQGFPDFSCPEALLEQVHKAMLAGMNQYAPMAGLPLLRQRIAEKTEALYGATVDENNEITVTCGATEALFVAIQAVVRPGDEVIVFDPAYDSYEPAVQLAGGRCVHIPLSAPDYRIDWQQVKDHLSAKTRLIIINSPHNPTGSVLTADDLNELSAVVGLQPCYLLSDEVYEHIVFDGRAHCSLLSVPALRARSFVVSSFGKTYHTTGWKVGYCVAPAAMTAEFRKIHQYCTFSISTPFQQAIAEFMADATHHLELAAFYQRKRDVFRAALADCAWELLPCAGTYFQLARYRGFDDRNEVEMARYLTQTHGIASIPLSVFYENHCDAGVLRFCFAKHDETLLAGAKRLQAVPLNK